MALNIRTYEDLERLVEDVDDDSQRESQDVTDYLDNVTEALRDLEASVDTASEAQDLAYEWLTDGKIDQDEYDQIESYCDDMRGRLSDARQEILNASR